MSRQYWKREVRVMDFCVNHARQIIAELDTSGGEHHEDVEELEALIETWEHLRLIAEEARMNERLGKA